MIGGLSSLLGQPTYAYQPQQMENAAAMQQRLADQCTPWGSMTYRQVQLEGAGELFDGLGNLTPKNRWLKRDPFTNKIGMRVLAESMGL